MRSGLERILGQFASKRHPEGVFAARNTPGTFNRPRNTQSPSTFRCPAGMKTSKPGSAAIVTRNGRAVQRRKRLGTKAGSPCFASFCDKASTRLW